MSSRREFLINAAGVVAVAGFGVRAIRGDITSPSSPTSLAAPVGLGYWQGSAGLAARVTLAQPDSTCGLSSAIKVSGDAATETSIIDARRIFLGNRDMVGQPATIRVLGVMGEPKVCGVSALESASIDILARPPGSSEPAPFHAWSIRTKPALSQSQTCRFPMHVASGRGIEMAVKGTSWGQAVECTFALPAGFAPGEGKLRPGVYFVGFPNADGSAPAMHRTHLFAQPDGEMVLQSGGATPQFATFVFSVLP